MLREAFQKVKLKRKETVDIIKSHLLLSSRNAGEYRPNVWISQAAVLRHQNFCMDRSNCKSPAHVKNRLFLTLLASAERNIYRYWDNIRQHRSKKTTVLLTSRMSNKLITKKKNMKFKKPCNNMVRIRLNIVRKRIKCAWLANFDKTEKMRLA